MVKKGDKVKVQGKEACVTSSWGQGKHTAWSLDDGRVVLDLDQLIDSGAAELLASDETIGFPDAPGPLTRLDREEDDLESWDKDSDED